MDFFHSTDNDIATDCNRVHQDNAFDRHVTAYGCDIVRLHSLGDNSVFADSVHIRRSCIGVRIRQENKRCYEYLQVGHNGSLEGSAEAVLMLRRYAKAVKRY